MSRGCGCAKGENGRKNSCCSNVPLEKILRSGAKPLSGIPLGGIGTGSVELRADGRFYEWQIFNNPPWSGGALIVDWKGEEILDPDDCYFAIRVKSPDSEPSVRILASKEKSEINRLYAGSFVKNIEGSEYIGEFPFAKINYKTDLPVEVQLDAFSPFIPLDIKNSALPAAVLTFTIKNLSNKSLEVSMLGGLVNAVGKGVHKGEAVNRIIQGEQFTAIEMTGKNIPQDHYQYQGSLSLSCLKTGKERITYRASQYVITDLTGSGSSGEEYWRILQANGELDNKEKTSPPFLATVLQSLPDLHSLPQGSTEDTRGRRSLKCPRIRGSRLFRPHSAN